MDNSFELMSYFVFFVTQDYRCVSYFQFPGTLFSESFECMLMTPVYYLEFRDEL